MRATVSLVAVPEALELFGRDQSTPGNSSWRLLAALVLERDLELRPIRQSAVLAYLNVLFDNLGDSKVTKHPPAALMAAAAASSQDWVLVPMSSVTR